MTLTKEEGLENLLFYDWYSRYSLIDHFMGEEATLESFSQCRYPEQGDFVNQPYQFELATFPDQLVLSFHRHGIVWIKETKIPIKIEKVVQLRRRSSSISIDYGITNLSSELVSLWFGIEFGFAMLAGDAPDRYYSLQQRILEDPRLGSFGKIMDWERIELVDEPRGIKVYLFANKKGNLWRFPLETISQSEAGFERVYQSSVLLPNWQFSLNSGETWNVQLEQGLVSLTRKKPVFNH